jgi:hypothetical protein
MWDFARKNWKTNIAFQGGRTTRCARDWVLGLCVCLAAIAAGCQRDMKNYADDHVRKDMLALHEKREAVPFLEKRGQFYDLDNTTHVDLEVVVPLLKKLNDIARTEQWAMIRPEKKDSAYGMLIGLPKDPKVVDRMAEAVQEADDKFDGFILQQWGHEWLVISLIDQQSYETLKKSNPDIDNQR